MKRMMMAVLAASMLTGTVAMADSHKRDHDRDERAWNDRHDDRGSNDRWDDRDHRGDRDRHDQRNTGRYDGRYRVARYYPPQNYRPHAWYRGARLPAAYYAPRYVIHNYGSYRLHQPPRGYHWVRVDNDVVLAAITTGVVMQVIDGIFY